MVVIYLDHDPNHHSQRIHDRVYLFLIDANWLGHQHGQLIETKRAFRPLVAPPHAVAMEFDLFRERRSPDASGLG